MRNNAPDVSGHDLCGNKCPDQLDPSPAMSERGIGRIKGEDYSPGGVSTAETHDVA